MTPLSLDSYFYQVLAPSRWLRGRKEASRRPDAAARLAVRLAARAARSQPAAAHPTHGPNGSGGGRRARGALAIVAEGHRGGLRRCPRLTAGVHLVIVQLLVVVRLLGVLAACQVQLADRGRAVAGAAGGVQGGGHSPLGMGAATALFATRPTGRQRLTATCACDLIVREGSQPSLPNDVHVHV